MLAPVVRGGAAGVRALLKRAAGIEVTNSLAKAAERFLRRQVAMEDASPFHAAPVARAEHAARLSEAQVALREGTTLPRRVISSGVFLWRVSTKCYHVHGGSYCDIGGGHEVPSRQADSVGRSGDHRPDCARRGLRLAGRRDATSTVKHDSVLPG